jgi:hypothetical protein
MLLASSYILFSLLFYLNLKRLKIIKKTFWEYLLGGLFKDKKQNKIMNTILDDFWLYLQVNQAYINLKKDYEYREIPYINGIIVFDMLELKEWEQIKEDYYANYVEDSIKKKNKKLKEKFINYEYFALKFCNMPILSLQKTEELIFHRENKKLLTLIPTIRKFKKKKDLQEIFNKTNNNLVE